MIIFLRMLRAQLRQGARVQKNQKELEKVKDGLSTPFSKIRVKR